MSANPIVVQLNPFFINSSDYSYAAYYDDVAGVFLNRNNRTSRDLSNLASNQFFFIVSALQQSRLVLVSGTVPGYNGTPIPPPAPPGPPLPPQGTPLPAGINGVAAITVINVAYGLVAGIIKATPGRLFYVTISQVGTDGFTLTDGLSGPLLFAAPNGLPMGDYTLSSRPFTVNLYANTTINSPAFTVGLS